MCNERNGMGEQEKEPRRWLEGNLSKNMYYSISFRGVAMSYTEVRKTLVKCSRCYAKITSEISVHCAEVLLGSKKRSKIGITFAKASSRP